MAHKGQGVDVECSGKRGGEDGPKCGTSGVSKVIMRDKYIYTCFSNAAKSLVALEKSLMVFTHW